MKKILAALALMVAMVTGSFAVGAPAQAALSDCTAYSNVICMWKYSQAQGSIWRQTDTQVPTVGCRAITESGWNNAVNTVRLQTTRNQLLQVFDSSNCSGNYVTVYRNFTYDLTGTGWEDKASSIKLKYYAY